jgi:pimeloyl-ACP methyl ester carboxylesterase
MTTSSNSRIVADVIASHRLSGKTFEAGGVGSFVIERGDGAPVVCLHGVPASSFLYRKVLTELSTRGLRGVAFDFPKGTVMSRLHRGRRQLRSLLIDVAEHTSAATTPRARSISCTVANNTTLGTVHPSAPAPTR